MECEKGVGKEGGGKGRREGGKRFCVEYGCHALLLIKSRLAQAEAKKRSQTLMNVVD